MHNPLSLSTEGVLPLASLEPGFPLADCFLIPLVRAVNQNKGEQRCWPSVSVGTVAVKISCAGKGEQSKAWRECQVSNGRVGPLISHSKGACSSKGVIKPQSLTDKQQYLENTDLTCSVKLHFSVWQLFILSMCSRRHTRSHLRTTRHETSGIPGCWLTYWCTSRQGFYG